MATMLEADIEDSAQREGIVLASEDSGLFGSEVMINSYSQNEIRLHKAQHLAIGKFNCSLSIVCVQGLVKNTKMLGL